MGVKTLKKRSLDDAPKAKPIRPTKKQRKQALDAYHSDSDSDADADADEFPAVNLLDSDSDDIHNARVDDGSASGSDSDDAASPPPPSSRLKTTNPNKSQPSIARAAPQSALALAHDAPAASDSEADDNDEYSDLSASDASDGPGGASTTGTGANRAKLRAKRTDPAAFATSLAKILSTKLATTRRADPVLARSADAHEASRRAVDGALETKARKQLRAAKRAAMERGRVRDVLVATNAEFGANVNPVTGAIGEAAAVGRESTGAVLATERRLRKVAQRGVVQLFNAFRTAQVKAVEAEKGVRKEGVIGVDRKKEKVTEMSKKGFLDLIAGSGGGLKKGAVEEA